MDGQNVAEEDCFAGPESLYPIIVEAVEEFERQAENDSRPNNPRLGCASILKEFSDLVDLVMLGRGFRGPQREKGVKLAVAALRFVRDLDLDSRLRGNDGEKGQA